MDNFSLIFLVGLFQFNFPCWTISHKLNIHLAFFHHEWYQCELTLAELTCVFNWSNCAKLCHKLNIYGFFFPSFTELTCLSIGPIVQSVGHKLSIYLAFFHHELNFKFSLYSKAVSFWIVTFKLTQNFLVDYISSFFLLDKISSISFVD